MSRPSGKMVLRVLCLIGLGLLPAMHAQGQICSQFIKCAPGYRCAKLIPGTITGTCTKVAKTAAERKEKEPVPACDTQHSREVCEKLEPCIWPQKTNACVTRCELRKTSDDCQRPGRCLWIPQTTACISKEELSR